MKDASHCTSGVICEMVCWAVLESVQVAQEGCFGREGVVNKER